MHTNKARSNHPYCPKRAIIKGFAGRARALCNPGELETELKDVKDVFVTNEFERAIVNDTWRKVHTRRT